MIGIQDTINNNNNLVWGTIATKNWCFWTVILEKTLESPLDCKEIEPVKPKGNQSWIFIGSTDAEADEKLIQYFSHLMQRTESLEKTLMIEDWRLKSGGEGDDRGWYGWMASPTQWTWVWASSGSWWWTGKPDVLQSMGPLRVRNNWATELTEPLDYVNFTITLGIISISIL